MTRLTLQDTGMDMMVKMAEGNPGAVSALMAIMSEHDKVDPQAALGPLGAILILDTWGIYGTDIYILYSDKCGRDVRKMLMIMRATQLGHFSETRLREMAHDQMMEVNLTDEEWEGLDKKVCDELKDFAKAA